MDIERHIIGFQETTDFTVKTPAVLEEIRFSGIAFDGELGNVLSWKHLRCLSNPNTGQLEDLGLDGCHLPLKYCV
jgi:hypothetical protein